MKKADTLDLSVVDDPHKAKMTKNRSQSSENFFEK